MLKRVTIFCLAIILMFNISIQAFAKSSDTYTKVDLPNGGTGLRLSREIYSPSKTITAETLGLSNKLDGLTDIYVDNNQEIFVLCGDSSKLYLLDSNYNFIKEIIVKNNNDEIIDYTGAKGIYSDASGNIYICDTKNARILIVNKDGYLIKTMESEKSNLIPDSFIYQPVAIEKDFNEYLYILSLGSYYGVLMYSPQGEFIGFYGANTVKASALDTLSYLWDKLFSNDDKKSKSVKTLPSSFVDFCFDPEGYMVTITGSTKRFDFEKGQIRKISHNGSDILYKRTLGGDSETSSQYNFLEESRDDVSYSSAQNLVAVAVSNDNYIFALDSTNGTIYTFDSQCNSIGNFGGGVGTGDQLGLFKLPVSLALNGNDVLVADAENFSITVFESTEYGDYIRKAQTLYLKGNYDDAEKYWQKVLSMNRNCQLAYRGMAMVYYNQAKYKEAMDAAEIALDYSVYDMSRNQVISDYVSNHFIFLLILSLAFIGLIVFAIIYLKKKNIKIKNKKVLTFLNTPIHPFKTFENLKYFNLGSYKIAFGVLIAFYIISVLNTVNSGFLYRRVDIVSYNSAYTLFGTIGLILLWSVCNWLACSIFSGKGTFKEVLTSTSYAISPYVLYKFILLIATNILPLSSSGLLTGLETAVLIYTFFLLSIAMIKVHEYDFFKFLLTGLVSVFMMLLAVFVALMSIILFKQVGAFVVSIYEEIAFR